MRTFIAVTLVFAGLLMGAEAAGAAEVHCAAYTQECGYADAPATGPIIPEPPSKCAVKKYRKHHKQACRGYAR